MNDFFLSLLLLAATAGPSPELPFWATAGQYGIMPESQGALAMVQARSSFDETRTLQWRWGASLAANTSYQMLEGGASYLESFKTRPMVDELYASLRWKCFTLDAGSKRREMDFLASDPSLGSLSVTGGHVAESGNARTMPGYLITLDPVAIPLTARHLWLYGAFGDFTTTDVRYVPGALVHRTRVFLRADFLERFSFHAGLDHYALWAGDHPTDVDIPVTFSNWFHVVTGSRAGAGAPVMDQQNVIGDQGGSELFRLEYRGDGWTIEAQHDIPYSDHSGMEFHNFPDGVNTLHFGFTDKDRWVSDLLYEYHYTMYQSGSTNGLIWTDDTHYYIEEGKDALGGDDYFNNGYYRSGWTHYGRSIGSPLFFPEGIKRGGWRPSSGRMSSDFHPAGPLMGIENNRYRAHHFGISGKLWKRCPYRLMLTWSDNHGTYKVPYAGESAWQKKWGSVRETGLRQFSAAFTGTLPQLFSVKGLSGMYGLYLDRGEVLPDNFGLTLGLRYTL